MKSLHQSSANFLWTDIQLSKGQLNKEHLITAKICGENEDIFYCSAPCLKYCLQKDCQYTVSIHDKRVCPEHSKALENPSTALWNLCTLGQKLKMITEDGLVI